MWEPSEKQVFNVLKRFGTPTYLYSSDYLKDNYLNLRNRLSDSIDVLYSLKANPNLSIVSELRQLGVSAEIASKLELETALQSGMSSDNILFAGPAKSKDDIFACIESGIYSIVCDSLSEIELVNECARERSCSNKIPVVIRINPDFSIDGQVVSAGGKPGQFGVDEKIVAGKKETIQSLPWVEVVGFLGYTETKFLEAGNIILNTTNMLATVGKLVELYQIESPVVVVSGGLEMPLSEVEPELDLDALSAGLNKLVRLFKDRYLPRRMMLEFGRYLVAGSGVLITRVTYTKRSMGEKFLLTDGGGTRFSANAVFGRLAERVLPIRNLTTRLSMRETCTIIGPQNALNDSLARNIQLKCTSAGDVLGILMSGAYGPTASPVYFLGHGYPAEVLVRGEEAFLIRKRDTTEDILNRQILV